MAPLGRRLGEALKDRYRVQEELGEGGAAVVYLAEDLKHHRPVAIKVLRPELAASVGTERFDREIEIAARLNHPHILALYDSGEADELHYFVMPHIEGESLRERIRREGPLPLAEAVRITHEIGDALGYAHEQGLIHRDIKPENILFQAGHALVADFGIARAVSDAEGTRMTRTGTAVGTLAYMSPEQATVDGEVDERADVYALGCVLHEMLAGGSPFTGKTPEALLAQKLMGTHASVGEQRDDVPPTVDAVVARALSKEPEGRYQTPGQLTADLEQAITAAAIEADARRRHAAVWMRRAGWFAGTSMLVVAGWFALATSGGPTVERLAVLPFTDLGGDPEQAYFVDGAHDAVITELQMAGVGVIARRSVLMYRNTETPIRDIARELGLDAVLEASVRLRGDSVTLDVRLVDGDTEEYLWLRSFESDVSNVMSLYRELTRRVAEEIGIDLSPDAQTRLAASPTVDPAAYEAYLKGRARWRELTPEGFAAALQYFEFALEIDPDFALAHTGIAAVAGGRAQMGLASWSDTWSVGVDRIRRALALDSTSAEIHYRYANIHAWGAWNWEQSVQSFQRALELNVSDPEVHGYYAHVLYITGQPEEAMAHAERALELDPVEPLYHALMGMSLYYEHRYEEGIERLEPVLELNPTSPVLLSTLRTLYHLAGRHEQAVEAWRASYAGDSEALAALNRGYETGGYEGALVALAEAMVERAKISYVPSWNIATMLVRAGRFEEAFGYLEEAFEAHHQNMPYIAVDPIFDPMRDDPRFTRLLEGLGLAG